jgi:hypothetical protein
MKYFVERALASLLLGVLALGPSAHAQRTERVVKANIPFEFNVNGRVFPAGNYSLVRTTPVLLQLRDAECHTLTTVVTNSVESSNTPASPRLQFYSDGGRHVLTQVWQENDSIGQQLQVARPLTKVAKRKHSKHVQTAEVTKPQ